MKRYWRVFISFTLAAFLVVIVPISADSQTTTNYSQNFTKAYLCLDKYCIQTPLVLDTQRTQKALQEIADNDSISINSIVIEEFDSTANIIAKDKEDYKVILTVNDDDAKTVGVTKKTLAGDLLERIKRTIIKYRITKYRNNFLQAIFIILIVLSILILGFGIIFLIKNNLPVSTSFLFEQKFKKSEYRIKKKTWDNFVFFCGKLPAYIAFVLIIVLGIRLIVVIFNANFYLTNSDLEELRQHIITLLNIVGFFFILGTVFMLLYWLSNSRAGTVVLAFEDSKTGEKHKLGRAIADSLVGELHRIRHIHTCLTQAIRIGEEDIKLQRLGEFNFPPLTPIQENIESNLIDVGTFEAGKTSLSIGRILLVLKWLWPFGGVKRVISGSLQTYTLTTRLFVRLEYLNQVKAWEVTWKNDQTEPITEKVRDLAYKVAMDLIPNITAQTWEGFKFFTEAIHNYYLYQHTGLLEHLHNAEENCKKARQVERKYHKLADLFYKIGVAYLENQKYDKAEKAFLASIEIAPQSESYYSHTGLGNVYYAQKKFNDAINQYERANRLNEDFPYPINGLGNIYFQKGEYHKAREYYESACTQNDKYWHSHFWKPYHNLGLIYLYDDEEKLTHEEKLTNYKKAEEKFNKAIEIHKYLKDAQELHSIHSGLALACFFQAIEELDRLHQKISKLKLEINNLQQEINNLQQEINNPGKETKTITKTILSLKKDIKEFENKLQVIKETEQGIEQQINKINSKLEDAIKQIKKAADIALESQPYIYWNLGLITLAQGKVDKDKVKEVCDAWEKAVIIASNQSDKLCIEIYKYAINALQKPNILTPKQALSKCIDHPLLRLRQGWLKIMLKDVTIISKILDEKNESINNLISILNENIEKS